MLHNVLVRQLPVPGDRVRAALDAAGIDPDRRPQTLGVGDWLRLREELGPIGRDLRGRTASQRRALEAGAAAELADDGEAVEG
jgi:hypothetical protein